jgi:imidazole glycerol-phosphate synthase subunit HisH
MIVVVDYGVGNLASVANMLRKAGADVCVSRDPAVILTADKLLLPGVGHFDHGMKMFNNSGLRNAVEKVVLDLKRPMLGICLGAQMLGKGSEEGLSQGLGWIDMECRKLPAEFGVRVPHMGWSELIKTNESLLFGGLLDDARFYFVHSYYMCCSNESDVIAKAKHGIEFSCAVQRNQIFGTQFHPEKSLRYGLALMKNFVAIPAK